MCLDYKTENSPFYVLKHECKRLQVEQFFVYLHYLIQIIYIYNLYIQKTPYYKQINQLYEKNYSFICSFYKHVAI